jgi:tetrapyrrole methylase family protein/MazG family protein
LPKSIRLRSFDALYRRADRFADIYARIADTIVAAAQPKGKSQKAELSATPAADVIYAVPGHPLVGERSVALILQRAKAACIAVRIVAGLSFVEPVLEALAQQPVPGIASPDPLDGLQLCDALDLARLHHPPLNPDKPALIAQVYARHVASDLKLTLLNQYAPQHPTAIVRAGTVIGSILGELDHSDNFDHLTTLYLPPIERIASFEGLQETIAYLRAPEGCPWDREQTHQSLRVTLLEEAYEVLTAIDEDDMPALKEELGDLLLNIVLQAQIATEAEEFRMSDVISEIDAKLKRRHPHIFGDVTVRNSAEVNRNWNEIKKREKAAKGLRAGSVLDGIAPALPALAQAQKFAHRADRAGFRWQDQRKRFDKILEELNEIKAARTRAHKAEELGDLLFTLAYWADGMGIDIESAAREGNLKFARRFRALEAQIAAQGRDMKTMREAELLEAWRTVKRREKRR